MADPQSLEEAFEELFATAARIPLASPAEFQSAARALAFAVLEEARGYHLNDCDGCKPDDLCGYHYMQRRIEALGK